MQVLLIGNKLLKTSGSLAVMLMLVFSSLLPAQALSPEELNKVKLVEQNLFFKTYDDESADNRIARIEKRVFGEPAEGSLEDRLAHVLQVAKPLEKVQPPKTPQLRPANPPAQSQSEQAEDERSRQEDAAEQARRKILQARNDEINQLLAEGVSLWKSKRGDEAVAKFQQVIRLAPDYAEAHFSLGVVYEAQGHYMEALQAYKRAAEVEPQNKEYRQAVALLEKNAQKYQEEGARNAELRSLAEEASGAYKRGEYFSALDLYKQLDEKKPNQALVKYNIATIYKAMKNPVQALNYLKQAHKLKPEEERFGQEAKQLESMLKRDEDERLNAERAWQEQPNNQKPNFKQAPNNNQFTNNQGRTGGGALGTGAAPPSASFGILIKPSNEGVLVGTIGIGSRAARAGLQKGDIIRAVDGIIIQAADQFQQIFSTKQPGQSVQLLIQRGGNIGQIVL